MIAADIRAQVIATRRDQGLPDHVTDRRLLDRLARDVLANSEAGEAAAA